MSAYGRFCPVSLATEVIGDRWTLLIVRELVLGNTRFNDIARGLPGISRTLLAQRLRHLERKRVVERWPSASGRVQEYHLTPAGAELESVVIALGQWAVAWLFDELDPEDVDPATLAWWMHRRVDEKRLPPGRVVIEFVHTAPQRQTVWIVLDRGEPSVCVQHPGFDSDVIVTMTTAALAGVFAGHESWSHAVATGKIRVDGAPAMTKSLPRWFSWSPFAADVGREAARRSFPPLPEGATA